MRFARREEVEGDLLRIPGRRMKENLERIVPLPQHVRRLLDRAVEIGGASELLFPGERGKPMSENTMLYALYRMGLKSRATVHGLRGVFSTAANESGLWEPGWIEMQLAHTDSSVRGVYDAALYLPHRRKMLEWWNAEIDRAAVSDLL